MKFDKNKVIDEGFYKAFEELMLLIVNSLDQTKLSNIKLSEIKAMIESFTIKEEKFINEIYYLNMVYHLKNKFLNFWKQRIFFHQYYIKKIFVYSNHH